LPDRIFEEVDIVCIDSHANGAKFEREDIFQDMNSEDKENRMGIRKRRRRTMNQGTSEPMEE
jgi:hypothetical protein